VIRYLGTYGQRRVRAAALLAPLPPFLPRSDANPDGADPSILNEFLVELTADRPAAVKTYLDRYYNIELLGGSPVTRVAIGGDNPRPMPPVATRAVVAVAGWCRRS
jgi:non-heme chloroperoxidase